MVEKIISFFKKNKPETDCSDQMILRDKNSLQDKNTKEIFYEVHENNWVLCDPGNMSQDCQINRDFGRNLSIIKQRKLIQK